ncbi:hypothetical protein CPLU01_05498 [Colletotrichum plurivorum]|uniref:Uncharacterized protein n=1 Tax=Colletotrichum plurivorum TaxID=2175906 RepID=A0A8H6KLU8_9PEZI|nr:hypothetical protein CPLU01_05498 [Colletotrichum plurivorum]
MLPLLQDGSDRLGLAPGAERQGGCECAAGAGSSREMRRFEGEGKAGDAQRHGVGVGGGRREGGVLTVCRSVSSQPSACV